jgi:hypothetical protein
MSNNGKVTSDSRLASFLYSLMRDHLPLGVVEGLVHEAEQFSFATTVFSNEHLARYAIELAKRLNKPLGKPELKVVESSELEADDGDEPPF